MTKRGEIFALTVLIASTCFEAANAARSPHSLLVDAVCWLCMLACAGMTANFILRHR